MRKTLAQIAGLSTPPQRYRDGGHVRGSGTGTSDSINIKASNGEFVLPTDTVRKVGVKRLQDLVQATHEPTGRPRIPGRYADGGEVKRANSFGDAAAAAADKSVKQVSTGPAPTPVTPAPVASAPASSAVAPVRGVGNSFGDAAAAARDSSVTMVQSPPRSLQSIANGASAAPDRSASAIPGSVAAVPAASAMPPRATTYSGGIRSGNSFGDAAAAAADASVQQIGASPTPPSAAKAGPSAIPTGGLQAPAPDGSQDRWSNTEVGRNLSNIASALPGAAGNVIPSVARTGGAISTGIDAATRLMAIGTGTAGASMAQPAIASAARSEPLSLQSIAAGRGNVNPAFVNPSAPLPASSSAGQGDTAGPPMGASGSVTRNGNSYSGTNVMGDVTFRNPDGSVRASGGTFSSLPSGAQPGPATGPVSSPGVQTSGAMQLPSTGLASAGMSLAGMGAADALASREYAASLGRLMASGQIEAPRAGPSLSLPGGSFGIRRDRNIVADERGAQSRFAYAMGNDPASRQRAAQLQQVNAQQQGETGRTMIRARSDAERTSVERGKLSLAQIAAGYDNRARERLDRAQSDLETAKTPEVRRSARERLLALGGHAPQNEWGLQVTPATKNLDGSSTQGSVYRYNKTTGETVRVDEGQGQRAQQGATPGLADPKIRPVGTISTVGGRSASWDGLRWVPLR